MSQVSFYDLAVEILHNIFDHLDVCTIITSVRCVSKQFYAIVNSYDRFQIDLRSEKKSFVGVISRLIRPSNVTSLILYNGNGVGDLIELFIKTFDITKCMRLRSLTFYQINESHIIQILQNINTDTLISLKIDTYQRYNKIVLSIVSSFIFQTNVQKLYLTSLDYNHNELSWPAENRLQHLTIRNCSYHGYHIILRNLQCLRTLKIRECTMNDTDESFSLYTVTTFNSAKRQRNSTDSTGIAIGNISVYTQLKSLDIDRCNMSIQKLECLLSLTPSLEHLRLVSVDDKKRNKKFDGLYWEHFIQNHLCLLNTFQFYFTCEMREPDNVDQLMSFILSFQSSFWLIDKHWPVTCDYIPKESTIRLFTIPICKDFRPIDLILEVSSINPTYSVTFNSTKKVSAFTVLYSLLFLFRHLSITYLFLSIELETV